MFYGLILGVVSAVAMKLIIGNSFMDIHAGVWGLMINLSVIIIGYLLTTRAPSKQILN
jgi:Na+/proline symporter